MDFERADFGPTPPQAAECLVCHSPISGSYYTINGKVVCATCQAQLAARPDGFDAAAFTRALGFGAVVAVAGSAVWYGVTAVTGYEFGLLAIGIGIVVGKAVQKGAGWRSGAVYPVLAIVLTYLSIVGANVPALVLGGGGSDVSFSVLLLAVLVSPFLGGKNVMGLIIVAIGLYEAWKYSRVPPLAFAGPFELKV